MNNILMINGLEVRFLPPFLRLSLFLPSFLNLSDKTYQMKGFHRRQGRMQPCQVTHILMMLNRETRVTRLYLIIELN